MFEYGMLNDEDELIKRKIDWARVIVKFQWKSPYTEIRKRNGLQSMEEREIRLHLYSTKHKSKSSFTLMISLLTSRCHCHASKCISFYEHDNKHKKWSDGKWIQKPVLNKIKSRQKQVTWEQTRKRHKNKYVARWMFRRKDHMKMKWICANR